MRLLRIDREVIAMTTGLTHNAPAVARVKVAKRIVVPPNSMVHVQCVLEESLAQYMVESEEKDRYLTPRTLHSSGQDPKICLLNVTDKYLTIKKGHDIAEAHVVSVVELVPSELEDYGYRACTVQAWDAGQSSVVPGH